MRILAINPGSTSTKIAAFSGSTLLMEQNLAFTHEALTDHDVYEACYRQLVEAIPAALAASGIAFSFDAIIARGGLGQVMPCGTYPLTSAMIAQNLSTPRRHPCNIGGKVAMELSTTIAGCLALTADPGVADEMIEENRLTGLPDIRRRCIWHALNHRAMGRRYAASIGRRYEDLNLIICHMGGGVSIAAHEHGRAVAANNALEGDGPMSSERSGSLPAADLVRLCFSGRYSERQLLNLIAGEGGLRAHLGTNDLRQIYDRINGGDKQATRVVNAMVLQISKAIAAEAATLCGHVDAIILTGGMAHSRQLTDAISKRTSFLAPIAVYPGEDEMHALAEAAQRYLHNATSEERQGAARG